MIIDSDSLQKRTVEEQIKLIDAFCSFKEKKDKSFEILTNRSLLITKFVAKRIKIMNKKQKN